MKWFVPLSPFAQVLVVAVLILLVVGVSLLAMQPDTKVPLPASRSPVRSSHPARLSSSLWRALRAPWKSGPCLHQRLVTGAWSSTPRG